MADLVESAGLAVAGAIAADQETRCPYHGGIGRCLRHVYRREIREEGYVEGSFKRDFFAERGEARAGMGPAPC